MKKYNLLFGLLLLFSAASAQEGWFPLDNSPGGNQVFFIDSNIGWILGSINNIYKTSDGGQTWDSLHVEVDSLNSLYISSIFFLNSEIGWAVGSPEVVLKSVDGGIHWNILHGSNLGYYAYGSVCFANENIGWAISCDSGGYGWIIKTNDGGKNWILQKELKAPSIANRPNFSAGSVCCIDTNMAWVVKGYEWESSNPWNPGILYDEKFLRTVDGGMTWLENLNSSDIDMPRSVDFIDTQKGLAVGRHGTIYRTIDGGVTWSSKQTYLASLNSVDFVNQNTGYAVGGDGAIIKTIDGGENWSKQVSGTSNFLFSVFFTDAETGWAVNRDEVLHTTSGGDVNGPVHEEWTKIDTLGGGEQVFFVDNNYGWILSMGNQILKTIDGGESWSPIRIDLQGNDRIYSIYFLNRDIGWGVGGSYLPPSGCIYKTTDGGLKWNRMSIDTLLNGFYFSSVSFANENIGWVAGNDNILNGILIKTVDGGKSWQKQKNSYNEMLYSVCCKDTNLAWAVGGSDYGYAFENVSFFLRTSDGGRNWISIKQRGPVLYSVDFINAAIGWAVGASGLIYHTSDGGVSWNLQESRTSNDLMSADFFDEDNGWAVGKRGTILKFNGIYWASQISGTYRDLSSVFALDSHSGWIVGSGVVLHSSDNQQTSVINKMTDQVLSRFMLGQNYPNPFNQATIIKYELPNSTHVELKIYDLLGQELITLIDEEQADGFHAVQWNGKNHIGLPMPSGMYLFRLETSKFTETKKMLLLK